MTLLLRALIREIEALARRKLGPKKVRVHDKVNARGEYVIGVIVSPEYPGEYEGRDVERDEKRQARKAR